jgi:hypothetical protein
VLLVLSRENFTGEELRLVRQAEWARKQTVDEVVEITRNARSRAKDEVDELLLDP